MMKRKTIFRRIFLGTLAMLLTTLSLYYIFIFVYEYENNKKAAMEESIALSNKVNSVLNEYIDQIDGVISSFYYELYYNESGALSMLLTSEEELSEKEEFQMRADLDKYFAEFYLMNNRLLDIYIYINEDKNYLFSSYGGKTLDYDLQESERYQATIAKKGKTHIMIDYIPEYVTHKKAAISLSRVIRDVSEDNIAENTVVMLDFSMKNIDDIVETYTKSDTVTMLLIDENDHILYRQGAEIDGLEGIEKTFHENIGKSYSWKNGKDKYIVAVSDEEVYEWRVAYIMNMDEVLATTMDYLRFTIVVGIFFFLVSVAVSYFFAKNISQPIVILKSGMATMQTGNFDIHLEKNSDDELGQLIDNFNMMALRIKHLIKEKYEEELQRKEAQYKFLQAQIDPHFIFNTLQIINSMAIVYKTPDIGNVSNNLAALIRYSISGDQRTIFLKEEIKNVKSYLDIQKVRFKNRLNYQIDMEEGLEEVPVIKLILQPIVENGICHGLENNCENGQIEIKAYRRGERVCIEIRDNGKGMSEEELQNVMELINSPLGNEENGAGSDHIGLRNINLRLKMHYGDDCGLTIESKWQEGTVVTVCIREENEIGEIIDCG